MIAITGHPAVSARGATRSSRSRDEHVIEVFEVPRKSTTKEAGSHQRARRAGEDTAEVPAITWRTGAVVAGVATVLWQVLTHIARDGERRP